MAANPIVEQTLLQATKVIEQQVCMHLCVCVCVCVCARAHMQCFIPKFKSLGHNYILTAAKEAY